jgi:hypothetical protein
MRLSHILCIGALLAVLSGCTRIADNSQRRGETPQASASGQAAQSSTSTQKPPVDSRPAGEQGGSASAPFIAETKAAIPVINIASPGRLEVIDGCLTVTIRGGERATAVFPPGVKPELKGNDVVAVSFEGRRIPLDQETPIPGGSIRLSSADLVKPIPSYCPKTLFGLGG